MHPPPPPPRRAVMTPRQELQQLLGAHLPAGGVPMAHPAIAWVHNLIIGSRAGEAVGVLQRQRAASARAEMHAHVQRMHLRLLLPPMHAATIADLAACVAWAHGDGPAPSVGDVRTPHHRHMCLGRHMTAAVAGMPGPGPALLRDATHLITTAAAATPGTRLTAPPRLVQYLPGGGQKLHAHGAGGEMSSGVEAVGGGGGMARFILTLRLAAAPTHLRLTAGHSRVVDDVWVLEGGDVWIATPTGEGRFALRALAGGGGDGGAAAAAAAAAVHRGDTHVMHGVPAVPVQAFSLLFEGEYDRSRYPTLAALRGALQGALGEAAGQVDSGAVAVPEGDGATEALLLRPIWAALQAVWGGGRGGITAMRGQIEKDKAAGQRPDVGAIFAASRLLISADLFGPKRQRLTDESWQAPLQPLLRFSGQEMDVLELGLMLHDITPASQGGRQHAGPQQPPLPTPPREWVVLLLDRMWRVATRLRRERGDAAATAAGAGGGAAAPDMRVGLPAAKLLVHGGRGLEAALALPSMQREPEALARLQAMRARVIQLGTGPALLSWVRDTSPWPSGSGVAALKSLWRAYSLEVQGQGLPGARALLRGSLAPSQRHDVVCALQWREQKVPGDAARLLRLLAAYVGEVGDSACGEGGGDGGGGGGGMSPATFFDDWLRTAPAADLGALTGLGRTVSRMRAPAADSWGWDLARDVRGVPNETLIAWCLPTTNKAGGCVVRQRTPGSPHLVQLDVGRIHFISKEWSACPLVGGGPPSPRFALRVLVDGQRIAPVAGAAGKAVHRTTNPHLVAAGLCNRAQQSMTPHYSITGAAGYAEALHPHEQAGARLRMVRLYRLPTTTRYRDGLGGVGMAHLLELVFTTLHE